ncbi:MAG: hypothetical protein EPO24_00060 [Bacteroidetes bacterium]|nr:MAG: hypothetical protein EPO24_00060 [Bacteroidota bacterium]
MSELQEYWHGIRTRVCPECIEGDGAGNCLLDPVIECPLQKSLPVIVDIITRTKPWKNEYREELFSIICGECKYQTSEGRCGLDEALCAAERYFSGIVQTIESIHNHHYITA